ncbi:hypothetical protein C8246_00020 [Paracidovorax avenae]|nr:hypothetical protein C8246_00020 [Paracidovorax avenae]
MRRQQGCRQHAASSVPATRLLRRSSVCARLPQHHHDGEQDPVRMRAPGQRLRHQEAAAMASAARTAWRSGGASQRQSVAAAPRTRPWD